MHSLRTKILTIVLVFLAFTGIAFVLYSMVTTMNYKQLRLEGITKTVQFETEKVNKTIAKIERGAIDLANNGLLYYMSQSKEEGETLVMEYLNSFPTVVGGGFWFEPYAFNKDSFRTGIYAFFDKELNEVRFDYSDIDEYDYHSLNWYREIIDAVTRPYQVVWTKPYTDDSSYSLMTTAGAGIFDRHRNLIGVSIIDWEIDNVIEELSAIKPTVNSFILLCAPEQDYVISSTRTKSVIGVSIKDIPWDINADSFKLDGFTYLRFGRFMDNGWLLSVQIPENEIFAEIERQNDRFSMIIFLSSVIMLCFAYYLVSKLINEPIKQLTSEVAQLALGNLDIRVETVSKDELGLLAKTFSTMAADLKESIEAYAREHTEKERISAELGVATKIQASMLPCIFPPYPDRTEFDIYASTFPAKEVGGDFYDFYLIDENKLVMAIADVAGKGIPAALFMVITKILMKNCSSCKNLSSIFESVNNKLCENNEAGMFVTAFMGIYNIVTGKFAYVNAGHNPPLLKKRGGGYEFLKTAPRLILAWKKDVEYIEEEITLEPGDTLYLYTDGVTEAMNTDNDLFSDERLLDALNKYIDYPPMELLPAIKREICQFANGAEQADDITMLALKVNSTPGGCFRKELIVEARIDNLDEVLDFVNDALDRHDCPSSMQNQIDIAVEEIFVNIARYAYEPQCGNVAIYIFVGEEIVIRFEDSGKPYNPLEQADPDLDKPLNKRKIGGLGIFLVKQLMEKVVYTRVDNKNVLTITNTNLKSNVGEAAFATRRDGVD